MQIFGPSQLHGPQGIQPPHSRPGVRPNGAAGPTGVNGDRLELSPAAQTAARLAETSGIRHDRVAELRQAIASGSYETEQKLSVAVDRLLDEIG